MKLILPFETTFLDYPDNESLAMIVRFLGCDNSCEGCQNKDLKDINFVGGKEISINDFGFYIKEGMLNNKTNKLVLSGGDPLANCNIDFTKDILLHFGKLFDICIYTGKDIDFVKRNNIKGFKFIKVGNYDLTKKCLPDKTDDYFQLASTNQGLYDNDYKLLSSNGKYLF